MADWIFKFIIDDYIKYLGKNFVKYFKKEINPIRKAKSFSLKINLKDIEENKY